MNRTSTVRFYFLCEYRNNVSLDLFLSCLHSCYKAEIQAGKLLEVHVTRTNLMGNFVLATSTNSDLPAHLDHGYETSYLSASSCLVFADSVELEIQSKECKSVLHAETWLLCNILPLIGHNNQCCNLVVCTCILGARAKDMNLFYQTIIFCT